MDRIATFIHRFLYIRRLFRHYKGGTYGYVCAARHSETQEWLVIYRDMNNPDKIWARPTVMFLDHLPNGKPRFEEIS